MLAWFFLVASCISVGLIGAAIALAQQRRAMVTRFLVATLFLGSGWLVVEVATNLMKSSQSVLCEARLAPALAALRGYRLYYPSQEGPVSGYIYGPLGAMAYVPCLVPGWRPSRIFLTGCGLSFVYGVLPAAVLFFWKARRSASPGLIGSVGLVCFLAWTTLSPALSYSLYTIHADAPALTLGAWTLVAWLLQPKPANSPWMCLLAFTSVAACFAKQPLVFVPGAVFLLTLWQRGWRMALTYLAFTAGWLVVGLSLFSFFNPLGDFLFNAVTIPGKHPWKGEGIGNPARLATRVHTFLVSLLLQDDPTIVGMACGIAFLAVASRNTRQAAETVGESSQVPMQSVRIPCVVFAACAFPFGVLGWSKLGGDVNAYCFAAYFLAIGFGLSVIEFLSAPMVDGAQGPKSALAAFLLLATAGLVIERGPKSLHTLYETLGEASLADKAFAFASEHPGQAYFPWQPFSVLLAEGKLYHFSYGLYDRMLAGYPVSPPHFWRDVPRACRYVVVPKVPLPYTPDYAWLTYMMTRYSEDIALLELPGFRVLIQPDAAPR